MDRFRDPYELCHYGVLGMRWGVRKAPDRGGGSSHRKLDKLETTDTIYGEAYRSKKGFNVAKKKINGYYLKPNAPHSKEFFDVGYKSTDGERLFRDIEAGYDRSKATGFKKKENNTTFFTIDMSLGVTKKRNFRTVWSFSDDNPEPRSITAYRARKKEVNDNGTGDV